MLIRNCAGGVVFKGDRVLLLKNDKGEWVLPKGAIRSGDLAHEVAVNRVQVEAGVSADIVEPAGQTSYEFFSTTRQRPVCNRITWYLMRTSEDQCTFSKEDGFVDGGFFIINEALDRITYSQDKSLVSLSYRKLQEA
ncbi:MAG: NUDIX hydrolase [Bacillota bacterium]